jgi:hypothetical protein
MGAPEFGGLYAYDATGTTNCSGTPKVCMPLFGPPGTTGLPVGQPSVANGVVYGSFDFGSSVLVFAADAAAGTGLWNASLPGGFAQSSPAIANGTLYIGSGNTLTAFGLPVTPVITTQPSDQSVHPGQIPSFTAAARGHPDPTVQWQYSTDRGSTWANISGNPTATTTTLSGVVYGTFENGWQVRAVFTNSAGSGVTNVATLTVT